MDEERGASEAPFTNEVMPGTALVALAGSVVLGEEVIGLRA